MHERLISSQHATLIACTNIAITARAQHYTVRTAPAHCTCIPACALRERSGTREVEVLRCFRAQCLPSLSKSLTHVSAVVKGDISQKISVPPCIPSAGAHQSTSHAPFSHPNPAGPARAAALLWTQGRFGSPQARFDLQGAAAPRSFALLPRACCKLEAHITTARLRRAGCSRPLLSR